MLRYALITPARDERQNLERLSAAVRAQAVLPEFWVLVDDGSTDGTREYASGLGDPYMVVVGTETAEGSLRDGRRQGRDLLAFQHGIRSLPNEVDVVVKVDADVNFEPDFFERLLAAFEADPKLAMSGGSCHEFQDGQWVRRKVTPTAVWGATRAYRWAVIDIALNLEPNVGWDGIDEIQAQLDGWHTRTLVDLPFEHHRPEGVREGKVVRAHVLSGAAAWYMGYRPSYLVLRSLYRARRDRAALGLIWGYVHSAATRAPRCSDKRVIAALRERQRLSSLRRAVPE
ncbi:glycosyltransferase [Solirubrobacter taibaiensis]|nr:glycosyltransferase [Solirubrobacter taibaiensis]